MQSFLSRVSGPRSIHYLRNWVREIWNRGLGAHGTVAPNILWPLLFVPLLALSQLISPSFIWMGLITALIALYGLSYAWIRIQIKGLDFARTHDAEVRVVGDELEIASKLVNRCPLPLIWCEINDRSAEALRATRDRVVACAGQTTVQWEDHRLCDRRGRYRFGPTQLTFGDPLGLFTARVRFDQRGEILIYPRVVALPDIALPQRSRQGSWQQRQRLQATARAVTVREYRPSDSLRFVHWPSTAHRGQLTVTEVESEPGISLTLVVDLFAPHHVGAGPRSTLEVSIMTAASLVAQTINASDQRQCGLLCAEHPQQPISIAPAQGVGHLWSVLHALAPLHAGNVPLDELLGSMRSALGRRRDSSVLVITPLPHPHPEVPVRMAWLEELDALRQRGVACGVVFIRHASQGALDMEGPWGSHLATFPLTVLEADAEYEAVITYRRKKAHYVATPFGGTRRVEVDEVVG